MLLLILMNNKKVEYEIFDTYGITFNPEEKEVLLFLYNMSKSAKNIHLIDIQEAVEEADLDTEVVDKFIDFLQSFNIKIIVGNEETDVIHAEEEIEPTVIEDKTNDPVKLYLQEMGTIDLLSRDKEVEIANNIIIGKKGMLSILVQMPVVLDKIIYLLNILLNKKPVEEECEVNHFDDEVLENKEENKNDADEDEEYNEHKEILNTIYELTNKLINNEDIENNQTLLVDTLKELDTIILNKLIVLINETGNKCIEFNSELMNYAVKVGYTRSSFYEILQKKYKLGGRFEHCEKEFDEFVENNKKTLY